MFVALKIHIFVKQKHFTSIVVTYPINDYSPVFTTKIVHRGDTLHFEISHILCDVGDVFYPHLINNFPSEIP